MTPFGLITSLVQLTSPSCDFAGFIRLEICHSGRTSFSDHFYIRADTLMIISKPPDIDKNCVAIRAHDGNRIYVIGTETSVAAARLAAILEYKKCTSETPLNQEIEK